MNQSSLGLEPKNVDFPGPGAYAMTRPWEPHNYHKKKLPFNSTSSRNDKRSFTHTGSYQVGDLFLIYVSIIYFFSREWVLVDTILSHQSGMKPSLIVANDRNDEILDFYQRHHGLQVPMVNRY
jgi:hypothetical protein